MKSNAVAMLINLNHKNLCIVIIALLFFYLSYLLWLRPDSYRFPDVEVELRQLISYAILSVEMGGHAVVRVHNEKRLEKVQKTNEGGDGYVTRADLISNHLMVENMRRFPGLKVDIE